MCPLSSAGDVDKALLVSGCHKVPPLVLLGVEGQHSRSRLPPQHLSPPGRPTSPAPLLHSASGRICSVKCSTVSPSQGESTRSYDDHVWMNVFKAEDADNC